MADLEIPKLVPAKTTEKYENLEQNEKNW